MIISLSTLMLQGSIIGGLIAWIVLWNRCILLRHRYNRKFLFPFLSHLPWWKFYMTKRLTFHFTIAFSLYWSSICIPHYGLIMSDVFLLYSLRPSSPVSFSSLLRSIASSIFVTFVWSLKILHSTLLVQGTKPCTMGVIRKRRLPHFQTDAESTNLSSHFISSRRFTLLKWISVNCRLYKIYHRSNVSMLSSIVI
jgi:hypothetical protein